MDTSSLTPRALVLFAAFLTSATAAHTFFGARQNAIAQVLPTMPNAVVSHPDCARMQEILQGGIADSQEERQAQLAEFSALQQGCMNARAEAAAAAGVEGSMPPAMMPPTQGMDSAMQQGGLPLMQSAPPMLGMPGTEEDGSLQMSDAMPGMNLGMPYDPSQTMQGQPGFPASPMGFPTDATNPFQDGTMPGFPSDIASPSMPIVPSDFMGIEDPTSGVMDSGLPSDEPWSLEPWSDGPIGPPSPFETQTWNEMPPVMPSMQDQFVGMDIEQVRMEERERARQTIEEVRTKAEQVMNEQRDQIEELQQRIAELESQLGTTHAAPTAEDQGSEPIDMNTSSCSALGSFLKGITFGMLGC